MHAACSTLLNDAEMANTNLPSPDPDVTTLLTEAYGLEGTAANDCYNAGATNKKLLAQSEHDAIKAEALYDQVLQRIRQIDGRVPCHHDDLGQHRQLGHRRDLRMTPTTRPPRPSDPEPTPARPATTSSTATAAASCGRCPPVST